MDIILTAIPVALVAVFVGSVIGFQLHNVLSTKSARAVKEASAQQLRRTNARSKEILLEAQEQALQIRSDAEARLNEQKLAIQRRQGRLEVSEETIQGKWDTICNVCKEAGEKVLGTVKNHKKKKDDKLQKRNISHTRSRNKKKERRPQKGNES